MSYSILSKYGKERGSVRYLISITMNLRNVYKVFKLKRKIQKMKRKLKANGIKYDKKILFNDLNERLLFIHIPKAAGMSVVKTLYNLDKSHHASASDYINEDKSKFDHAFSFAITRNPYMRLYSAYNYLKNGGMNKIDRAWWELYLAQYENFNAFILEGGLEFAIENNAEHFIPQYKFIFDENEDLQCNYVGKVEQIDEVELALSKQLQKEVMFTHNNVMSKQEAIIENIFSNDMLAIVNKCYQKDFSLLNYKKI